MAATPIPVDLLLFDFDGTLTNSIPPAIEAVQKMLKTLGLPPKTKEEIHKHVGFGEVPLISGAIGSSDKDLIQKALDTYTLIYKNEGIKNIKIYPHVREMLDFFKNKTKVIVSNKSDEFIGIILNNLGLKKYFDSFYGGDTAPCLKPDPCAILHVLEKYGASPKRTIFVGDMTVDIETGKNAGVFTCAVTYGFDGKDKLKSKNPDLIIDDIIELTQSII
jgi:phosphoglycolate phosphatase